MTFWENGLTALSIARAFNAVLAREFEEGEKALGGRADAATCSLMMGKGQSAFEVAAVILDLAQREFSKENYARYLDEFLQLDRPTIDRAVRVRFPEDGAQGYILPLVVRRELSKIGAGNVSANLDKYMRGFEIAGFVERKRTKHGSELAYKCTEKAEKIEKMISDHLNGKDAK